MNFDNGLADIANYEKRVRELEAEGMCRSDAQSVADVEVLREEKNAANAKDFAIDCMENDVSDDTRYW